MTLADRLRTNAAALDLAIRLNKPVGRRALRALVADMLQQAVEADRLAEAQAAVAHEAQGAEARFQGRRAA